MILQYLDLSYNGVYIYFIIMRVSVVTNLNQLKLNYTLAKIIKIYVSAKPNQTENKNKINIFNKKFPQNSP